MRITFIYIFFLAFSLQNTFSKIYLIKEEKSPANFFELKENIEKNAPKNIDKQKGFKPVRRLEYLRSFRIDSSGKIPSAMSIFKEHTKFLSKAKIINPLQHNQNWQEIGPRSPQRGSNKQLSGSGRINCIAFDPNDSNLIWAGAASSGLWKSTNRGKSWEVVPFTEFLSMGVSDIAISSQNPDIIYVATGDADGSSFFGCYSLGIIKSTDKGQTWEILPTGIEYSQGSFISKLLLHPENDSILYAATSNAIIKTSNGGKHWDVLIDRFNFRDICFKPNDYNVIYATTYSINDGAFLFKSEDGGNSWFIANRWEDASRVKLATTPLESQRLLALCVNKYTSSFGGLYLSDSEGYFWETLLEDTAQYSFLVQAQGFFNLVLEFFPQSRDEFFIGGVWLYRGKLRSNKFIEIPKETHVDMHDIKCNTHDGKIYLANDGGIYRFNSDFSQIENISSNLGITQFYRIGLNPYNPNIFYAGSQDNNVFEYFYNNWQFLIGGDGMECFVSPKNPSLVYSSTQRGTLYNSLYGLLEVPTDERRPWVTPFLYHPAEPGIVLCGYENVWITQDDGKSWEKISNFADSITLNAIAAYYYDRNVIAAANSKNVYLTKDFGKSWEKVFSSNIPITSIKFDVSRNLWVTVGGFQAESKVFVIKDNLIENQTFNLPNVPISCIEIDTTTGIVYIGTDIGVFHKAPMITLWEITGEQLPAVIISELEMHYGTGTLFAATFGRGIWALKLWDCPVEKPVVAVPERVVFCPDENILLEVLNPQPSYEYVWNNGTKGKEILITEKGNYYVSAINLNGCVASSDTVYIWKPDIPKINLFLLSANPICEGDTARLLANYKSLQKIVESGWSDGRIGNLGQFTKAGRYYFWLLDEFSCKYLSDTVEIFVNPRPPKPNITKAGNWLVTDANGNYQWYRNDTLIKDFFGNRCFILQAGKYFLIVRDTNLCFNVSDTVEITFQEKPQANMQIKLNPNIIRNYLNLELNLIEESPFTISIYNSIGQIIYKQDYLSTKGYIYEQIDISSFGQSLYYINITNNFGSINRAFAILR
jgi:hypothetical protein